MNTIEVYKTDVEDLTSAQNILDEILRIHPDSDASFDIEDCDKVLRVENSAGVDTAGIRKVLDRYGFQMENLLR